MGKISLTSVVAANVRGLMDARGLRQAGLATLAGVSQKTISNLLASDDNEARPKSATLDSLDKVANALRVEPWKLLMDLTAEERIAWDSIEAAFKVFQSSAPKPTLAITTTKANGTEGR